MKILVLNGSPKKKSDTFRLTEAFLRGMNRGETHEVHLIHVREKQIAPCRGWNRSRTEQSVNHKKMVYEVIVGS